MAMVAALASLSFAHVGAQSISVNAGSSGSAVVAPSGKLTVPVIIDLTSAGPLNIASLQSAMSWGASLLTLDSIRVVPALGWSLFPNLGGVGGGSISLAAISSIALPATSTLANAYFTASATPCGTRVLLAPTSGGNDIGTDITTALRARSLDVCIATTVKWGDVNATGVVDIIDAQQITRYSAGLSVANLAVLLQRGDVTADGLVNIIDAQQIARFSVGLSASPRVNTDFVVVPATTSMTLSPSTTQSLLVGRSGQVTAMPVSGATDLTGCAGVTWGSTNAAAAVVNASGFVTAVAAGSTNITATSGAVTTQVTVNVVAVPVASVAVALGAPAIQVGTTTTATATTFDAGANVLTGRTVVYSSGNTAIATVNSASGVVTGVAAGSTVIFATSEGITGQANVTVTAGVPTASVTVALGAPSIVIGATTTGTATPRDALNNVLVGRTITWSSSNPAVATVNAATGVVTGVSAGSANIIATADGVSGFAAITVTQVPVASVSVAFGSASIQVGTTTTATATTRDAGSNVLTGRVVAFSSSNTAVATVNAATGLVTAVAVGTANIFATSEGITGQAAITVTTFGPLASVTVTLGSTSILVGATTQATSTLMDASSNILSGTTTWTSSNTAVATVNAASGLVTAVGAGSANIIGTSGAIIGQRSLTVALVPVATVTVGLASGTITIAGSTTGTATTKDASGNTLTGRVIAWSSSNTAIATVNASTGAVTGVAVGTANILATSESRIGQAAVTVTLVPVSTVTVTLGSSSIATGATTTATAVTKDVSGNVLTGRVVTWSSSAPAVATASAAGVVTGVTVGTSNIVATSEGKTGQAVVTVAAPPAVASLTVTLANSTISTTGTTTATAVAKDASGNVLTGVSIAWSSSAPGIATVIASTGAVSGVAAGSANIIATSGAVTGQAALTVGTVTSAEPTGMTLLNERLFNSTTNGYNSDAGWHDDASFSIVTNALAPKSPPNVGQLTYPPGFVGGSAAGTQDIFFSGANLKTKWYVSAWIRIDQNWQGHATGTNKLMFFWINGGNRVFLFNRGSGSNPLEPTVALQGIAAPFCFQHPTYGTICDTSPDNLPLNVGKATVSRGDWHRYEVVLVANTPGVADGSIALWFDGQQVQNYTGIMYSPAGAPAVWEGLSWSPTWGGGGDAVINAMIIQIDHMYISAK